MKPPAPRRWVQGVLLAGFFALFLHTAYKGFDLLDWPVHLVFRLDPLAFLAEVAATGAAAFAGAWLAAGLLLLFTAILGRFFCGWACPLGTALDLGGAGLRRIFRSALRGRRPPRSLSVALLFGLAAATLLGLPLLGVFDPLSLLLRSLTVFVHPMFDAAAKGLLGGISRSGFPGFADGLYDVLGPVLAFGSPSFDLAGLTALVFAGILALELSAPRFWCTSLCPLGALLGLAGRLSPLRRAKSARCGECTRCAARCPTGAADSDPADSAACIQCDECRRSCPRGARRPELAAPGLSAPGSPTRRAVLTSAAGGALLALVPRVRAEERERGWDVLRPPGARPEDEFRSRCIRCGACMRVCPRGALHPALLETGLGGMWTPRLVPRLGYCEYHCRLCGQVCPTGAIGYLEEGQKEKTVIGVAFFEAGRCLPYRKAQNCMVCEEHCPTSPKAIAFRDELRLDPEGKERLVKVPRVVESLCIGCGICENKCPLPGKGAIIVGREKPGNLSSYY